MKIIVGSYALKLHDITLPRFYRHPIKEIDYIVNEKEEVGFTANLMFDVFRSDKLIEAIKTNYPVSRFKHVKEGLLPPLDVLLTLKLSHLHIPRRKGLWVKHASDVYHLMNMGVNIDKRLYNALRVFWSHHFNEKELKAVIKLEGDNKTFFKTPFNQHHDEIHERFKLGQYPAYQGFLKEGEKVKVSKSKFDNLTYEIQLNSVVEECMVTAFERQLSIPWQGLEKLTTELSKGWWNQFIFEHFKDVVDKLLTLRESFFIEQSHHARTYLKQLNLNQ